MWLISVCPDIFKTHGVSEGIEFVNSSNGLRFMVKEKKCKNISQGLPGAPIKEKSIILEILKIKKRYFLKKKYCTE